MGIIDCLLGGEEEETDTSPNDCGDHYYKPWDEDSKEINSVYRGEVYGVYIPGTTPFIREEDYLQSKNSKKVLDERMLFVRHVVTYERECIHDNCHVTEIKKEDETVKVLSEDLREVYGDYDSLPDACSDLREKFR